MSDKAVPNTPSQKSTEEKKQKKKNGYIGWWLFRTKGTVAEPWPTAEELWNDPNVQEEVKAVREAFKHTRNTQNI